ncbi:MAG: exonuclease subunit SbcD [Bacteroidales bacterium]|nr:exonuclease subunit SbcD [Bacteroidales bacterium]
MNNNCRILHTGDWHLGKRLEDFSRLEEQRAVMDEICQIANKEEADIVVVSGDLFDTFNPSTEAVDLFYKTLKRLTNGGRRPVIAIAGNHDSPDRIEAPDPLARECGIIFAGYPNSEVPVFELETGLKVIGSERGFIELSIPGKSFPIRLLLTPYANEYRLKSYLGEENSEEELRNVLQYKWQQLCNKYCDNNGVNILISHLFMIKRGEVVPEEPEDEKPILHVGGAQAIYSENIPRQIQYTALGHLHRMHKVDDFPSPIYYSGSPISYSFSEANQKKFVLMVDVAPGETAKVSEFQLSTVRPLLRKRAYGVDDAIAWLSNNSNALVELTLVTDTYITAKDRRRLNAAHNGIVTIIPEILNPDLFAESNKKQIDLNQSMESLFNDYFTHIKGQLPNEDIMNLFKEILAEEDEE